MPRTALDDDVFNKLAEFEAARRFANRQKRFRHQSDTTPKNTRRHDSVDLGLFTQVQSAVGGELETTPLIIFKPRRLPIGHKPEIEPESEPESSPESVLGIEAGAEQSNDPKHVANKYLITVEYDTESRGENFNSQVRKMAERRVICAFMNHLNFNKCANGISI
jgi:hypothetical protein